MQTEALVALTPDDLVRMILKKQRDLAKALPDLLKSREEELSRAYQLTKEARMAYKNSQEEASSNEEATTAAELLYNEREEFRRRSESRTHQLRNANANVQSTLMYWSDEERPWTSLLEAAQRVAEGHPPTFASKQHDGGQQA